MASVSTTKAFAEDGSLNLQESEIMLSANKQVALAQQDLDHRLTKWQAVKANPQACIYILILVWALVTVGYENQASGIILSVPTFRRDFGYAFVSNGETQYILDALWQSAITGGASAALVFGSLMATTIVDYTGRKWLITACVAGTIACVGAEFAATNIQVFFVGKFLNAILLGVIQTIGTSYVAELTPLSLRGICTVTVNLSFCVGPFICTIVAYFTSTREDRWAYRAIFCSQWFFAVTASILMLFVPESPYHHVLKENDEKALRCLRKFYPDGSAESQLAVIRATVDEAKVWSKSGSWFEVFNKKNAKRTLIAIAPFLMQPLSGLPYVMSYQTYYFQSAGITTRESFKISCGAQALSVTGTILSLFMVDRFGRRFILLYGMISLAVLNLLIAALGLDKNDAKLLLASAAFMTMFNFFYNSGIGPIAYVFNTEILTSRLRAKSVAIGVGASNSLNTMWAFVLPYMFNADQANMGSAINFIFSGCCFVSVGLFYFYMPEASGRSYEEIDEMFSTKVPYRKWASYTTAVSVESKKVVLEQSKGEMEHVEDVTKEKGLAYDEKAIV